MKLTKVFVPVVFTLGLGVTVVALENQNNSQLKLADIQAYAATNNTISSDNTVDNSVFDTSEQDNKDTTSTNPSQPPVMVNGINISIGESMQDVESKLGRPYDDNKTIVAGDASDQLVYTNMLHEQEYYIYCDNGIVTGIQDAN